MMGFQGLSSKPMHPSGKSTKCRLHKYFFISYACFSKHKVHAMNDDFIFFLYAFPYLTYIKSIYYLQYCALYNTRGFKAGVLTGNYQP